MLHRIRKKDTVVVISGKDKGKQGEIIEIDHIKGRVKVRGVALATIHRKPRNEREKGEIVQEERFIAACKVMPFCSESKRPCRVRIKEAENGKRVRVSHRSGAEL
jgi:large subunit ribosomal protein L24